MKIQFNQVKNVLEQYEDARDNDNLLMAIIWDAQVKRLGQNIVTMNAWNFLKLHSDGKLASTESVTRARRKVQELHPELRGKNYAKRQGNQKDVKRQLGYE